MVKLKKYNVVLKHFVLFLTFLSIISCASHKIYVTHIDGKQVGVTTANPQTQEIEDFVKPYRENIDKDLSAVLAYAPETIDKSKGQWQTTIGNLLADVTLQRGNLVFEKRENKHIDICLLNHGGIRAGIPKGNVTARTAYEIMPFENSLLVIGLRSDQIKEIANYIIKDKKPHPLSGMTFTVGKDNVAKNIMVNGKPLKDDSIYYVATSDYLANGGDNMNFFKSGIKTYDLDYKLRNLLIDYFKEVDTIPVINDKRIFTE